MTYKVLHVLNEMERGGIATWLMTVLRHIDRRRFQMDFFVHTDKECTYDAEARSLGSRIFPCGDHKRPWSYAKRFVRVLDENGPYQAVHCHCHRFSGFNLWLARHRNVPVRIAHSHSDERSSLISLTGTRRVYTRCMSRLINHHATVGLAASNLAGEDLFGPAGLTDPGWNVFYCGIDLESFLPDYDPSQVRAEWGIPEGARVIGHVGRFTRPKNHGFLLSIFSEVVKMAPTTYLVLVGDGPLEQEVRDLAAGYEFADNLLFPGSRPDVARLMIGCFDLFVFPSLSEGLGLALVEAQAAGLRCLISDAVPEEAIVVPQLVRLCSLSRSPEEWAAEVLEALDAPAAVSRLDALAAVERSVFNIRNSIGALESIYSAT